MSSTKNKWEKIYADAGSSVPQPCEVLRQYRHLLPQTGNALDVACGLGGNALYLASQGLPTTAVDISENAIGALTHRAFEMELTLHCVAAPVEEWLLESDEHCFDVIVVSRFLDRLLLPQLIDRLSVSGLIYYQTFTADKATPDSGPSRPEYLLKPNELLSFSGHLLVRAFYDPGSIGRRHEGFRNESYLVAQKVAN